MGLLGGRARRVALALLLAGATVVACAKGNESVDGGSDDDTAATTQASAGGSGSGGTSSGDPGSAQGGATSSASGGAGGGASGAGAGAVATACPPGEFATGFDADGQALCATIDAAADAAISAGCSVYLGVRDSCGGCGLAPAKWGFTSEPACANGLGANNTCQSPSLGGDSVQLFGLNTDGDVNDDDKLYLGFHCPAAEAQSGPGPCEDGEFVTEIDGSDVVCTPASGVVLDYVRASCSLYLGWRDECDGCATAPTKWGRVGPTGCDSGVGSGNTCMTAMLGAESVELLGLSTGGDVNDDDKLYLGLRCVDATAMEGPAMDACPPGQLVTAVDADGTLTCATAAPLVSAWFREHCNVWFGWRDSCDGCVSAPSKWGKTRDGACSNGAGADNTCIVAPLGAEMVQLFGLNTDGDVDDDDKLYVGFRCQ